MHESWEVKYWTRELGVSKEETSKGRGQGRKFGRDGSERIGKPLNRCLVIISILLTPKLWQIKAARNCVMTRTPKRSQTNCRTLATRTARVEKPQFCNPRR
jgi:uncharacterized protein DUF3606